MRNRNKGTYKSVKTMKAKKVNGCKGEKTKMCKEIVVIMRKSKMDIKSTQGFGVLKFSSNTVS